MSGCWPADNVNYVMMLFEFLTIGMAEEKKREGMWLEVEKTGDEEGMYRHTLQSVELIDVYRATEKRARPDGGRSD